MTPTPYASPAGATGDLWDAAGTLRLDVCDPPPVRGAAGEVEVASGVGMGEGNLLVPLRLLYDMRRKACFASYVIQQRLVSPQREVVAIPPQPSVGLQDGHMSNISYSRPNVELEVALGAGGLEGAPLRLIYRTIALIAAGDALCCVPVCLLSSHQAHQRAAAEPSEVREHYSRPVMDELRLALVQLVERKERAGLTGVYAMLVL